MKVKLSFKINMLIFILAGIAAPVVAQDVVSGTAEVLDSDILKIGTQRVILWGIDAPERTQFCIKEGARWGCAEAAFRSLELLAGRGEVACLLTGEADPFGRRFGVCESGGQDIAAEMVRRGMALAFLEQTEDYLPVQIEAIQAETGVWALGVEMEAPWDFRRANTPGGFR